MNQVMEEFEKAFENWRLNESETMPSGDHAGYACALWAARWMAKYLAEKANHEGYYQFEHDADQIAKDLGAV